MLIIDQAQVPKLLPMRECMDLMADALGALARGDAVLPLRTLMRLPTGAGILGLMPAYLGTPPSLGVKLITVFPGNEGSDLDSHLGAVLLFDPHSGELRAMIDASSITAIRTAAVSGVATRLLAREDASTLCILGSGVQAETHLEAMSIARTITSARLWSRTRANADRMKERVQARFSFPLHVCGSAEEAVRGADIVCTTTASREPVVESAWVSDDAHLNVVGASMAAAREVDSSTMRRARLFVDRRESTLNESGDFLIPRSEGVIGNDHIIAEIGELLIGKNPGRTSANELTLFKSLGLAVEDVAAAHHVYARARELGVGLEVELGGRRHA